MFKNYVVDQTGILYSPDFDHLFPHLSSRLNEVNVSSFGDKFTAASDESLSTENLWLNCNRCSLSEECISGWNHNLLTLRTSVTI